MDNKMVITIATIIFSITIATIPANCEYYTTTFQPEPVPMKQTQLHFYLHDIISGDKPSAVLVARPNKTDETNPTPFGTVFAIDDPLTEGPEATSTVIGNARGLYVSAGQDKLALVMYVDFGFTSGEFKGSSISVFSRNPVTEPERELAVVGGRGAFRMAKGFALLKTNYLNFTNGDAVIEYKVNLFHY